ncbi:hypothetical protein OAI86_05300 [Alphaproteobacteria bacterium]|nr:hypothetical protein [Alphaproteobacteria bacterium]
MFFLFFTTNNALSYCSSPSPPDAPSTYLKPGKSFTPFCINELMGN